jgi:hypothetical protein
MKRKLIEHIAQRLRAIAHCRAFGNTFQRARHEAALDWLVNALPSGDIAVTLNARAYPTAVRFNVVYRNTTEHLVTVVPCFVEGMAITMTGSLRVAGTKLAIEDALRQSLSRLIDDAEVKRAEDGPGDAASSSPSKRLSGARAVQLIVDDPQGPCRSSPRKNPD